MIYPPPMSLISKPDTRRRKFRVHVMKNGRPLCGGGRLARLVTAWQQEIGEPNCKRCQQILNPKTLCKSET